MSKKLHSGLSGILTFAGVLFLAGCSGSEDSSSGLLRRSPLSQGESGDKTASGSADGTSGPAPTLKGPEDSSGASKEETAPPTESKDPASPEDPKDPAPPEDPKVPPTCSEHTIDTCASMADLKQQALTTCTDEGASLVEKVFGAACQSGVSGINFKCCK